MRIAVCIPTHNRPASLARCLDSLSRQDFPLADIDLLVYDDASPAEAAKEYDQIIAAAKGFHSARLIRGARNIQVVAARKELGAQAPTACDLLLYVDDDAMLEPKGLSVLVRTIESQPRLAAVGPRLVFESDPSKTAHGPSFVSRWTCRYQDADPHEPVVCDWMNTTCLLIRRQALLDAGNWDERFVFCHEEADLGLRLQAHGWILLYQPAARCSHDIRPQPYKRDRLYFLYRNKFFVIRKNFPALRRTWALGVNIFLGTPAHLWECFRRTGFSDWAIVVRALVDGLKAPLS